MGKKVDVDELMDASEVAALLGVAHRNTVSVYQRRYPSMPRPIVERGGGRTKLWLRAEVMAWAARRKGDGVESRAAPG